MATRARRLRNTVSIPTTPPPAPVDPLDAVRAKFARLSEIQTAIAGMKTLYEEHDRLLEELAPCFFAPKADGSGWDVKNQITIGNRVYRMHPTFFNAEKNKVVAKKWKSAAFPTMFIEG